MLYGGIAIVDGQDTGTEWRGVFIQCLIENDAITTILNVDEVSAIAIMTTESITVNFKIIVADLGSVDTDRLVNKSGARNTVIHFDPVLVLVDEPLLGLWVIGHQVDVSSATRQLLNPLVVYLITCV